MGHGLSRGLRWLLSSATTGTLTLGAVLGGILSGLYVLPASPHPSAAGDPSPARASALSCAGQASKAGWVGTWSASQIPASTTNALSERGFHNQTLREYVPVSLGGTKVRVRLSNRYGSSPLIVDDVHAGPSRPGGAVDAKANPRLSFSGMPFTVIPPGGQVTSDPVSMALSSASMLAVSVYLPGLTGPTTWEPGAYITSYVSRAGDHSGEPSAASFPTEITAWYLLAGVDVYSPHQIGSVVAFGDSITSGYHSTVDARATWPDALARRILATEPAGHRLAVLDAGIDANELLNKSSLGPSAKDRFGADVAAQTGVRTVIFLEGTNDLRLNRGPGGAHPLTAGDLISGMRDIIAQAHAHHLRILGGTIPGFKGDTGFYSARGEATRRAVNHWIRTSGAFDGVVDFAAALRDPADGARIRPAYGGPLHPNDAGYQVMANAVDLNLLCP